MSKKWRRVLIGVIATLAVAMIAVSIVWIYFDHTPEAVLGILGVLMAIAILLLENMRS